MTIHPFEDGNGRIARVLTDMVLARDERMPVRYYTLSAQIMDERKKYYNVIEKTQRSGLDITGWLIWFLECFIKAVQKSEKIILNTLKKSEFWQKHSQTVLNQRQIKVINKLLDAGINGFEGGLTTRKYVSMTKVSRATAFRELSDLIDKRILVHRSGKGRNVSYELTII